MKRDITIEKEFLKMYGEYADAIFRHCYFRVFDREQAKDLMQDTFAKTWRYLTNGGEIRNAKSFLYKVATNLIINFGQRKKTVSLDALREQGFEPVGDDRNWLENLLTSQKILEELDRLDERYGRVITMRFVNDLSPREISEIIGESENAVSVRLHRALNKIKELINEKGEKHGKPF